LNEDDKIHIRKFLFDEDLRHRKTVSAFLVFEIQKEVEENMKQFNSSSNFFEKKNQFFISKKIQ